MLTTKMITKAAATLGTTVDFSGDWTNGLGSKMTIAMTGQRVTGTYESSVSGGGGPVKGDLVGFADGDLISFVVNWATPASLTAWTGQLVMAVRTWPRPYGCLSRNLTTHRSPTACGSPPSSATTTSGGSEVRVDRVALTPRSADQRG